MSAVSDSILADLATVDLERQRRARDPELARKVQAVKHCQQRRFAHSYADLLASAQYGAAARFFLDELYGPQDFSARDAQFVRVVPALVRLFPAEIVDTVGQLAALHALSEGLDSQMGQHLRAGSVSAREYVHAWQQTGRPGDRERQIALTLAVGADLDRLTRKPLLRHSLRLLRGPAQAAALASLQRFLEAGFDTFRAMHGAAPFLDIVGERERALAAALFACPAADSGAMPDLVASVLGQLP